MSDYLRRWKDLVCGFGQRTIWGKNLFFKLHSVLFCFLINSYGSCQCNCGIVCLKVLKWHTCFVLCWEVMQPLLVKVWIILWILWFMFSNGLVLCMILVFTLIFWSCVPSFVVFVIITNVCFRQLILRGMKNEFKFY